MLTRKKILAGNVPTEELKELRQKVARKIDLTNHRIGLNMHIRNELGKVVRIETLSVVDAYKQHEAAYQKIVQKPQEEGSAGELRL